MRNNEDKKNGEQGNIKVGSDEEEREEDEQMAMEYIKNDPANKNIAIKKARK